MNIFIYGEESGVFDKERLGECAHLPSPGKVQKSALE